MQRIKIIVVGKVKEKFLRDALDEYKKRLSRYCRLEIIEVSDDNMKDEAMRILPKLYGKVFPLCIEGESVDSEGFAKLFKDETEVTFVIGGSDGLADEVKKTGHGVSFSKMTFPHQLMRVILLEQIYRGFRILNGEPYHK